MREGRWEQPTAARIRGRAHAGRVATPRSSRTSNGSGPSGVTRLEIDRSDLTTPEPLRAAAAETSARCATASTSSTRPRSSTAAGAATPTSCSRRIDPSPALGTWHYEVADTKLARRVKGAAILQMCVYSEQLERAPGGRPETDPRRHRRRRASTPTALDDYAAYYRTPRAGSRTGVLDGSNAPPATYPDPVDHCRRLRLVPDAASTVAAPTTTSSSSPGSAACDTERLRTPTSPRSPSSPSCPRRRRDRGHRQRDPRARPPAGPAPGPEAATTGELRLRADPDRDPAETGSVASRACPSRRRATSSSTSRPIPAPSRRRPRVPVRVVDEHRRRAARTSPSGATTAPAEKAAFEALHRPRDGPSRRRTPSMHVYHYARLRAGRDQAPHAAARHARRRGRPAAARRRPRRPLQRRPPGRPRLGRVVLDQADREVLPAGPRSGPVTRPGSASSPTSAGSREASDQAILDGIAAYNRDDCVSTWRLRDWLEERRGGGADARWPSGPVAAAPRTGCRPRHSDRRAGRRRRARSRPDRGVPGRRTTADRDEDQQARWLLAQLLDWHRRDDKPRVVGVLPTSDDRRRA